jgi:hypothetical protein
MLLVVLLSTLTHVYMSCKCEFGVILPSIAPAVIILMCS